MTRLRPGYVVVVLLPLLAARPAESRNQTRAQPPAHLAGGTVAAIGDGALVIDPDSGELVRVDAVGRPIARVAVARDAAQVVFDREQARAYVSDRRGDQIAVVTVGDRRLVLAAQFKTRAEPYGLALSPDRKILFVTTVADRQLSALDAASGAELWTQAAGAEPRGVALSPDGRLAAVASLRSGAVGFFSTRDGAPVAHVALAPTPAAKPVTGREDQGRTFARNAFALAFVGDHSLVVPHQLSNPDAVARSESRGTYGGGGAPPITHRLSFIDAPERGLVGAPRPFGNRLPLHQPRALAYDAARDRLYVAGFGDDAVIALAHASQASVHQEWRQVVRDGGGACGPSGLAVGAGGEVIVYCELSRRVAVIAPAQDKDRLAVAFGPSISNSRYSPEEQEGRALFFSGGNGRVSGGGNLACASCHPEGRADGLSWRIEGANLQTPILAGRTVGTHPFKWDGKDATIEISLTQTVKRLGGLGISKVQASALDAFLATLAPPRAPTPRDTAAVQRGRQIFASVEAGCASCHSGELFADGQRHDLAQDLEAVDTPSLIGVAQSAPYYHDGSAATLKALLLGNASVHGMGRTRHLAGAQLDDLIAYLETL